MAWASATPRNNATASATTGNIAFTVTSTTAGDLGVVVIEARGATAGVLPTVTPPSGFVAVSGTPVHDPSDGTGSNTFLFYFPNMGAGTTSFTFTMSGANRVQAVYGCWGGGSAGTVPDGLNSATGTGTTTMPSVTSVAFLQATELVIWVGGENSGTAPGLPSGTGTWSNVNSAAGTGAGAKMAAQLGPASGATATASGSSATSADLQISIIVGFSATSLSQSFTRTAADNAAASDVLSRGTLVLARVEADNAAAADSLVRTNAKVTAPLADNAAASDALVHTSIHFARSIADNAQASESPPAGITIDSTATGTAGNAAASVSCTLTIGVGATLLIVLVQENTGSTGTFGSVTCGASSMTQLNATGPILFSAPDYLNAEIWYLVNPPSGSQTITANAASFVFRAGGAGICAVSMFGTLATSPVVNQGTGSSGSSVTSVTLTAGFGGTDQAGSLIFGGVCAWINAGAGNPTNGTADMSTLPHSVALFMASHIAGTAGGSDQLTYDNSANWGAWAGNMAEVLEAPGVITTGVTQHPRTASDNAAAADVLVHTSATYARTLSDNVAASDSLARAAQYARTLSDNAAASDSLWRKDILVSYMGETLTGNTLLTGQAGAANPTNVGDMVIVGFFSTSAATSVTDTSGEITWDAAALVTYNSASVGQHITLWRGIVASTGSATTITVNGGGTVGSFIAYELHDLTHPTRTNWFIASTGTLESSGSSTVTLPNLTTTSAADQTYWGFSVANGIYSAGGSPSTFYWNPDGHGNVAAVFTSVSPTTFPTPAGALPLTSYQPSYTETSGTGGGSVAIIIVAAETFAVSMSDNSAASDVLVRGNLILARSLSDNAAAADALTRTLIQARTNADNASASDVLVRGALTQSRTVSDNAVASDVLTRSRVLARSSSDNASASDSLARGNLILARTVSDNAAASDALTRGGYPFLVGTATGSANFAGNFTMTVPAATQGGDVIVVLQSLFASRTPVTPTGYSDYLDAISTVIIGLGGGPWLVVYTKQAAGTVGLVSSDAGATVTLHNQSGGSDTNGYTSGMIVVLRGVKLAPDTSAISATNLSGASSVTAPGVTTGQNNELVLSAFAQYLNNGSTYGLTPPATSLGTVQQHYNDIAASYFIQGSAGATTGQVATVGNSGNPIAATIAFAPTPGLVLARSLSDNAANSDVLTRGNLILARSNSDNAAASDALVHTSAHYARTNADNAAASDSLVATSGGTHLTRSASDNAAASDALVRGTLIQARTNADNAAAADSLSRALVLARSTSDNATATDVLTRTSARSRSLADGAAAQEEYPPYIINHPAVATALNAASVSTTAFQQSGLPNSILVVILAGWTGGGWDANTFLTGGWNNFLGGDAVNANCQIMMAVADGSNTSYNFSPISGASTDLKIADIYEIGNVIASSAPTSPNFYPSVLDPLPLSTNGTTEPITLTASGATTNFNRGEIAFAALNLAAVRSGAGLDSGFTLQTEVYGTGSSHADGLIAGTKVISADATLSVTASWSGGATGSSDMLLSFKGIGPSLARQLTHPRSLADNSAASDSLARGALVQARTASDNAAASDGLTRVAGKARSVSDNAAASDVLSRAVVLSRALADNAANSDVLVRTNAKVTVALADNSVASDSLLASLTKPRSASDNAAAADVLTRSAQSFSRTTSDNAAASDALARGLVQARTLSDNAAAIDTPGYDNVVIADGAVAFWKLNEANGSTTVADSAGTHPGTAAVSAAAGLGFASAPGALGGTSLSLTGDSPPGSRFTVAPDGALLAALENHDFSVECWNIIGTSLPGSMNSFTAGGGGGTDPVLHYQYQTGVGWYIGFFGDDWNTGTQESQGPWHHVVFTFNATTKIGHLYIDGVDIGSTNTYANDLNADNTEWAIGGAARFWNSWKGQLSRLSVYDKVLTSTQVTTHYNAASSVGLSRQLSLPRSTSDNAAATDSLSHAGVVARALSDNSAASDVVSRSERQTRSLADNAVASDVLSRQLVEARALSDNSAASDVLTRALVQARTNADNAAAADVLTRAFVAPRTNADNAAAADSLVRGNLAPSRSNSDNAAASDALTRSNMRSRSNADNAAATDALVRSAQLFARTTSDNAAATDALTRALVVSRTTSDNAAAADTLTRSLVQSRVLADNSAAVDALVRGSIPFTRSNADNAAASDTISRALVQSRTNADNAAASDVLVRTKAKVTVALADNSAAADALVRGTLIQARTNADNAAASDVLTRSGTPLVRSNADNAAASDVLTRTLTQSRTLADNSVASDSLVRSAQLITRSTSDNAAASDVLTRHLVESRTLADNSAASDGLTRVLVLARSVSDNAAAADALTRSLVEARSVSDNAAAADALTRQQVFARSLADGAAGSDILSKVSAEQRLVSDNAAASDSLTRQLTESRSTSDNAAASDSLTRHLVLSRTVSDNSAAADSLSVVKGPSRSFSDNAAATDAITRILVQARSTSDNAAASDSLARQEFTTRSLSDGGSASDSLVRAAQGPSRSNADNAAAIDSLSRTLAESRALADASAATDSLARSAQNITRSNSDNAAASDSLSRLEQQQRSTSDNAAAGDSLTRVLLMTRTASDNAVATDALTRSLALARTTSDGASASDALARSANSLTRSSSDGASASDALSRALVQARLVSDNAAASDALVASGGQHIARTATDNAAASDSLARLLVLHRTVSDSAAASDALAQHAESRTASDNTAASDGLTSQLDRLRSATDAASAADSLTRAVTLTRTATDGAAAQDGLRAVGTFTRTASDNASATDILVATRQPHRILADTAAAFDVLTLSVLTGELYLWTGFVWRHVPIKMWTGTVWKTMALRFWTGSAWRVAR